MTMTKQTYEEIQSILADAETKLSVASELIFEALGFSNIPSKLLQMGEAIRSLMEVVRNHYVRSLADDDPLLTWDPDTVEDHKPPF